MTPRFREGSNWLDYWSFATTTGNTVPLRDPDDDDEAEDEENDEPDEDLEPAIIREPDEWANVCAES
jgi:hypothetical protein